MNRLLRSILLRRALSEIRRQGFWLRDFQQLDDEGARVPETLKILFAVDLRALDAFLAKPNYWESSNELHSKCTELRGLREDAAAAYIAGDIDLAIRTVQLVNCEAKLIGMRVTANPVMVTRRQAQARAKEAQQKSAYKNKAATAEKLARLEEVRKSLVEKYGRATMKGLAGALGASEPTLRSYLREKNIEI